MPDHTCLACDDPDNYGVNCATCDATKCLTCKVPATQALQYNNQSCFTFFENCLDTRPYTATDINPKTGEQEFKCSACQAGFAWSNDEWNCVDCSTVVPFCQQCNDVSLTCSFCDFNLVPDLLGTQCSISQNISLGCGLLVPIDQYPKEYDSIRGKNQSSCSQNCLAGFEWDPITWTCTKTPGIPYCNSFSVDPLDHSKYICTGCNTLHFNVFLDSDNTCTFANCDIMNKTSMTGCIRCTENLANFRLNFLEADT